LKLNSSDVKAVYPVRIEVMKSTAGMSMPAPNVHAVELSLVNEGAPRVQDAVDGAGGTSLGGAPVVP
jgi:hypothetical protein